MKLSIYVIASVIFLNGCNKESTTLEEPQVLNESQNIEDSVAYSQSAMQSSSSDISPQQITVRYQELISYCTSIGLTQQSEGTTSKNKSAVLRGELDNGSTMSIIPYLQVEDNGNRRIVGYSLEYSHPQGNDQIYNDYQELVHNLTAIIRKHN